MPIRPYTAILALAVFCTGCASAAAARRDPTSPYPSAPRQVAQFQGVPDCPFDDLGLLRDDQRVGLRVLAFQLGADAVMNVKRYNDPETKKSVMEGEAIRFVDPDCRH